MAKRWILPHPQKKFGEIRLNDKIAPTLLSTDYKAPPLVWIEYNKIRF